MCDVIFGRLTSPPTQLRPFPRLANAARNAHARGGSERERGGRLRTPWRRGKRRRRSYCWFRHTWAGLTRVAPSSACSSRRSASSGRGSSGRASRCQVRPPPSPWVGHARCISRRAVNGDVMRPRRGAVRPPSPNPSSWLSLQGLPPPRASSPALAISHAALSPEPESFAKVLVESGSYLVSNPVVFTLTRE